MSDAKSVKGIEENRASYAYQIVSEYLQKSPTKIRKEYRAHLRKFSTMVLTNGLGQTLAFYFSKGEAYKAIYEHLQQWMQTVDVSMGGISENGKLIEAILGMEQNQYRLATKQILGLVSWMSRFADGMLDKNGELIGEAQGGK